MKKYKQLIIALISIAASCLVYTNANATKYQYTGTLLYLYSPMKTSITMSMIPQPLGSGTSTCGYTGYNGGCRYEYNAKGGSGAYLLYIKNNDNDYSCTAYFETEIGGYLIEPNTGKNTFSCQCQNLLGMTHGDTYLTDQAVQGNPSVLCN